MDKAGLRQAVIARRDALDLDVRAAKSADICVRLVELLLRQYMHNTEIAVTMRLSTILKTIKQPL